eukprot:3295639-Pyramimonas_sp.AAC.2
MNGSPITPPTPVFTARSPFITRKWNISITIPVLTQRNMFRLYNSGYGMAHGLPARAPERLTHILQTGSRAPSSPSKSPAHHLRGHAGPFPTTTTTLEPIIFRRQLVGQQLREEGFPHDRKHVDHPCALRPRLGRLIQGTTPTYIPV